MQNLDPKLNLLKLKRLIDSGITAIPADNKFNSAVLVIGDTGVGKTTILSFLAKRKLYIKILGLNTILDSDDNDGLKIGHDRFSQTRVPAKIIVDHMVFFDCSGFKDNRGQQFEISNSFFVQRLFDIYKNIKILLIIDENSVSQARADKLPKLIRNLLKSFSSLSDIQDGVIILINKAKPEFSEKIYCDQLLKLANLKGEEGHLFNQEERNFINYLVKNHKVCLFKQARKQDEGKLLDIKEENLINLIRDTQFVKNKKIKNIISESAKLCIRDFIDRLALNAQDKINSFSQQIIKQFSFESKSSFSNAIDVAKETKRRVIQFSQNVENQADQGLVQTIRRSVSGLNLTEFEQDVSSVLFFKNIYNKSDYYFKLVRSSISSSLTKLLINLDAEIKVLEDQQRLFKELQQQNKRSENTILTLSEQIIAEKKKAEILKQQSDSINKKIKEKANEFDQSTRQKQLQIEKLEIELSKLRQDLKNLSDTVAQHERDNASLKEKTHQKDLQLEKIRLLVSSLQNQKIMNLEQLQLLRDENQSLFRELQQSMQLKASDLAEDSLNKTTNSTKSSTKYPGLICPHFKNGGQCIHCIRKWKAEQKQKKKQK